MKFQILPDWGYEPKMELISENLSLTMPIKKTEENGDCVDSSKLKVTEEPILFGRH